MIVESKIHHYHPTSPKKNGGQFPMTNHELTQLRKTLEEWHDDVLRKLTALEHEGRELQQEHPEDIGERSVRGLSKELLFQQATHNRQLLRSIEAAIERIRLGTFGRCVSCGNEIRAKRLAAMPFTAHCRDCQESLEREQVSVGRDGPQRQSALEKFRLRKDV
jgi:DnaK suppressor protein